MLFDYRGARPSWRRGCCPVPLTRGIQKGGGYSRAIAIHRACKSKSGGARLPQGHWLTSGPGPVKHGPVDQPPQGGHSPIGCQVRPAPPIQFHPPGQRQRHGYLAWMSMVIVYNALRLVILLIRSTTMPPPSTVSTVRANRLGVNVSKS